MIEVPLYICCTLGQLRWVVLEILTYFVYAPVSALHPPCYPSAHDDLQRHLLRQISCKRLLALSTPEILFWVMLLHWQGRFTDRTCSARSALFYNFVRMQRSKRDFTLSANHFVERFLPENLSLFRGISGIPAWMALPNFDLCNAEIVLYEKVFSKS